MCTLAFGHHENRTPTHGYEPTREAAMAAELAARVRMTWDPDDKDRTALHEAGHAVVAWSFGVTVGCIHLDLENKSGHTMVASTAHLQPFEQIAQCLAGFEAEQAFKPPANQSRAGYDRYHHVPPILRANGTSDDEPKGQELLRQGHICSEKRLHEHESKVRAVARHLVEHHYMDRVVFEAMMKEN
jgi:hypothetical protein